MSTSQAVMLDTVKNDLNVVVHALVSAQPDELVQAQQLLDGLVRSLGELDAFARRSPSSVAAGELRQLRALLKRAGALSGMALESVERHMTRTGLQAADAGFTVQVRG